ncbi:MAG: serine hydrolase domain-containing protein [Pyrinomonadaceae bacterium]
MSISFRNVFLAACTLMLAADAALSQDPTGRFEPVRVKIERLLVEQKIPSISVAVAENGKIVWEEGFGFADRERRVRATPRTSYNIGSTSKPITATALMMLGEQGKLKFDSPANEYLAAPAQLRSSFGDVDRVTVRRLLDHTSGLSRHSQMLIGDEIAGSASTDETVARYGVLTKPAGEAFEYSNLNYALLSHIVSRVSGKPFDKFLDDSVFEPLAMRSSYSELPRRSAATGYYPDGSPLAAVLSDTPGAADVYSSVHDLLLFGMFHLGTRPTGGRSILTDSSLAEMKRGSSARGAARYGLGWESIDIGKYKLVYHHGSNGYGTSIFFMVPERRIVISILTNITTGHVQGIADDILGVLIPDYAAELTSFRQGSRREETSPYLPSAEYLGHWKGTIRTWREEIPVEMFFQPDGDVQIQLRGQYRSLLNGVRFEDGYLRGSFQSNIGTPDANRHRYNLHLKLKLRDGGRLDGAITSSSTDPTGNVLSSLIQLVKDR